MYLKSYGYSIEILTKYAKNIIPLHGISLQKVLLLRFVKFLIKFGQTEKGTKFEKIFHFQFNFTQQCQILSGRFFQILCLSQKVRTLKKFEHYIYFFCFKTEQKFTKSLSVHKLFSKSSRQDCANRSLLHTKILPPLPSRVNFYQKNLI